MEPFIEALADLLRRALQRTTTYSTDVGTMKDGLVALRPLPASQKFALCYLGKVQIAQKKLYTVCISAAKLWEGWELQSLCSHLGVAQENIDENLAEVED